MKKLIVILLTLISVNAFTSTIDTIQVKSEITDVTVFFTGAQISRHIDLSVSKGGYLILVDKLPFEINSSKHTGGWYRKL